MSSRERELKRHILKKRTRRTAEAYIGVCFQIYAQRGWSTLQEVMDLDLAEYFEVKELTDPVRGSVFQAVARELFVSYWSTWWIQQQTVRLAEAEREKSIMRLTEAFSDRGIQPAKPLAEHALASLWSSGGIGELDTATRLVKAERRVSITHLGEAFAKAELDASLAEAYLEAVWDGRLRTRDD